MSHYLEIPLKLGEWVWLRKTGASQARERSVGVWILENRALAARINLVNQFYKDNPEHRLRGYNGSELYAGKRSAANILNMKQCNNDYDQNCNNPSTAHFCHHVSASKMRELSTNTM